MRIDLNISAARGANEASGAKSGQGSAGSVAGATTDAVRFSLGRASVQALSAAVGQMPEIRQERVAALSQMISQGSYQVSAEQLAEALIRHATGSSSS